MEPRTLPLPGPTLRPDDVPRIVADIAALYERAGPVDVVCDAGALTRPDLGAVEAIARIRLAVRRAGGRVTLCNSTPELTELLGLVGLGP